VKFFVGLTVRLVSPLATPVCAQVFNLLPSINTLSYFICSRFYRAGKIMIEWHGRLLTVAAVIEI